MLSVSIYDLVFNVFFSSQLCYRVIYRLMIFMFCLHLFASTKFLHLIEILLLECAHLSMWSSVLFVTIFRPLIVDQYMLIRTK